MLLFLKTGCIVLFLSNGGVAPPQWAKFEVKDPATCSALLTAIALVTDPDAEKKLEPLKPLLQPDDPAPEEKK